jgi:hypothetical protein
MSLREKYLSVKSGKVASVEVEQWGTVFIRNLTLADLDKLKGLSEAEAIVAGVIVGCCDENGQRVFNEDDKETLLNSTPFNVLADVAEAVGQHNNLSEDKVQQAKNV